MVHILYQVSTRDKCLFDGDLVKVENQYLISDKIEIEVKKINQLCKK